AFVEDRDELEAEERLDARQHHARFVENVARLILQALFLDRVIGRTRGRALPVRAVQPGPANQVRTRRITRFAHACLAHAGCASVPTPTCVVSRTRTSA